MSLPRRAAFSLVLLLVVLLCIELAAWGLLRQIALEDPGERLRSAAGVAPQTALDRAVRGPGDVRGQDVIHPYVGHVVAPRNGSEADGAPSPAPALLDLEALGFPFGGPLVRERPPDKVVMGIFGGSAAAYFVASGAPERLFAHLEALEPFAGREPWVLSTAQGALKQPQSLMALAYLLSLGAVIDVVILLDGFNEVTLPLAENHARGVFPFYPAGWSFRLPDAGLGTTRRLLLQDIEYQKRRRADRAATLQGSRLRHSRTILAGWLVADRRAAAEIAEQKLALMDVRDDDMSWEAKGPRWPTRDREGLLRDLVFTWRSASRQMDALARAHGIRFYHFLQPNQYVGGSKPMGSEERAIARTWDHPYGRYVPQGYPLLREAGAQLRSEGVSFHDLTMAFAGVEEPLYVDDCCHVNPRGNEILADAMAAAILAEEDARADETL